MTARFMLDSDQPDTFPVGVAHLLATYSDLFPVRADLEDFRDHHAGTEVVLIDRGLGDPTGLASVADVEKLALTLPELRTWFELKRASGVRFLTAYSDRNTLPGVDSVLSGLRPWHWVATLDGTLAIAGLPALVRPAVVQCFSEGMLGIHADGSLVLDDRWHGPAPK